MTYPIPKFQEEYSAKIPALALLCHLGWELISPKEALELRDNRLDQVILNHTLRAVLQTRTFQYAGKCYPLSENSIDYLIAQMSQPALNEGLLTANEKIYNHLLYGISVTEFVDGKKINPTIAIIDWEEINNNCFQVTEEFSVARIGADSRRPDIVCFVNGIPLSVIEAKRPDAQGNKGPTIDEGISQMIRNQRHGEIPQLFAYSQLLLSINGHDGRYATCGTPKKFWASWREEDISQTTMREIKNRKLSEAAFTTLFQDRKHADKTWFQSWTSEMLDVTAQDILLISLLSPERLLELTRFFMIFDDRSGKIAARYQQFFSIRRLLERISTKRADGSREGGVVWHTTGSGKSFTMVFLSKALILNDALKQCRIVVVTDRVDLEKQLSKTFRASGALAHKKDAIAAMATSGRRLAEQIGKGNERIIFSLIQKFNTATKYPECFNDSSDIIVLIDEGHRSQGGENHIRMRQALPKAAFIAFTGTPLLKKDKTANKFGPIIHAYTMQRAVEDQTVTPLLYEERIPELEVNERAIDSWFDRITATLTEAQKADLKRKYSRKGAIYSAEDRIQLIALDIANHFDQNIDEGLKGQLACDSKISAIKYKEFLDEVGLFESAIVMSPPDTREGNESLNEEDIPLVTKWWQENVGSQDESQYTEEIIQRFADPHDPLKLLIVVDKLLTGFDEPKNAVLYIDKPLKEHNLMQAIARVNRLHDQKEFGLLIDYRGILKELDITIAQYQDLAAKTQSGYDIKDLQGLYHQMGYEYKKLPALYQKLWSIFDGVKNKQDIEQLKNVLIPKMELIDGMMVDLNEKRREDFYEALSEFASCLKIALQSMAFFKDTSFTEAERRHYKETVKQLSSLRQLVQQSTGEKIDYDEYSGKIKKLLDKHVVGLDITTHNGNYEVVNLGKSDSPEDWDETKRKNEIGILKNRIVRMIEQDLADDPYAQAAFSELLKETIEKTKELFDHSLKQYLIFQELEEKISARELEEIPTEIFAGNRQAQAYFGIFKQQLPTIFEVNDSQVIEYWAKLALTVDEVVDQAIAEHSINPENIEADIQKKLLPILYKECKNSGFGMVQTKEILKQIIQIVRVGLHSHGR